MSRNNPRFVQTWWILQIHRTKWTILTSFSIHNLAKPLFPPYTLHMMYCTQEVILKQSFLLLLHRIPIFGNFLKHQIIMFSKVIILKNEPTESNLYTKGDMVQGCGDLLMYLLRLILEKTNMSPRLRTFILM